VSLRSKVLLFVLAVSTAFAGTSYVVQHLIMLPEFSRLEQRTARSDLARCVQALQREADFLAASAVDYAAWDDTYRYVGSPNAEYEAENLIPETLTNLKLDALLIVRPDGSPLWAGLLRPDGTLAPAPELFAVVARSSRALLSRDRPGSQHGGLLATPLGPMLVGAAAITSSDQKSPMRGAVILGRLVDSRVVAELAERTRVAVELHSLDAVPEADRAALARLSAQSPSWIDTTDADRLRSYTRVADLFGAPALLVRTQLPRVVSKRALAAAKLAAATSLAGGLAMLLVMWFVLDGTIVGPLTRVTRHAVRVGSQGDLRTRLAATGRDEIAVLARELDRMVDRLAESRSQMLEAAHRAGRAEVATNVLHDIGNVLNSANVSAQVISEALERSEVPTLSLAARMLDQHRHTLGDFLSKDERGQHLPEFLAELASHLEEENEAALREMKSLSAAIDHIRQVVQAQNEHAQNPPLIEWVDPARVVDQALAMTAGAHEGRAIRIERRTGSAGPAPLEKHRVLQILTNLLANARHAVDASECDDPRISIELDRVREGESEELRIAVGDNGVGIARESLERIFALGYSTRPDGWGVGLHSAANLAREMSGSLTAESDGPGRGAVFTLRLPLRATQART
jgi:sensor domain CHASE-containing protein